jgi:hypothetical protein
MEFKGKSRAEAGRFGGKREFNPLTNSLPLMSNPSESTSAPTKSFPRICSARACPTSNDWSILMMGRDTHRSVERSNCATATLSVPSKIRFPYISPESEQPTFKDRGKTLIKSEKALSSDRISGDPKTMTTVDSESKFLFFREIFPSQFF